jgi:hypothetical protein
MPLVGAATADAARARGCSCSYYLCKHAPKAEELAQSEHPTLCFPLYVGFFDDVLRRHSLGVPGEEKNQQCNNANLLLAAAAAVQSRDRSSSWNFSVVTKKNTILHKIASQINSVSFYELTMQ